MSEEQKVNQPQNDAQEVVAKQTEADAPKPAGSFNQEDVDRIVKQRLEAEKQKHQRLLDEQKKKEDEALKEKQIQEAKTKADLENLMKQRIAEKDTEIQQMKADIKKERIDNNLLSVASKHKAINPAQVVELVKGQVRLSDDNRIEVLDQNNNIRYNSSGELFTIEDKVKEFIDANPHFRQGSLAGTGSTSSIEGKAVKPFNISDLDMSKAEDRKRYSEYRKQRNSQPTQINLNK
tara:strand:+ start:759 stop:1463 length:705 start_codon:yes stop_codon:yes gene_type:complete